MGLFDIDRAARRAGRVGRVTANGSRCLNPNPPQHRWRRSTKTTPRATCPSCTASIMPRFRRRHEFRHRLQIPAPSAPAPDPDRPTLHKGGDASTSEFLATAAPANSSTAGPTPAPDRIPSSNKQKKKTRSGYVENVATLTDPDRPHLFAANLPALTRPSCPASSVCRPICIRTVAVSDAQPPRALWNYIWANPDDEDKMKAAHGRPCAHRPRPHSAARAPE